MKHGSRHPRHTPLAEYALLSDCHSAALVSRQGSVDWLCLPQFDSPSIFGRLLDGDAGHWSIRATGTGVEISRRYRKDSLVLKTRVETTEGVFVLTELLAMGRRNEGHELGRGVPHAMLRSVRCVVGRVELEMEYAPRPEYGIVRPLHTRFDGGVTTHGGAVALDLYSDVDLTIEDGAVRARFALEQGETRRFALQYRRTWEERGKDWSAARIQKRTRRSVRAWRSWSEMHQAYDGPWAELVHHSGRVLQGLTFFPTGAMVAAPTTSLPEVPGGERNWDYRFCWIRDASFTLEALWVAACPDESEKFFRFLSEAALPSVRAGGEIQVVFGVGGERDLSERELPHLAGWEGSRPVRIGNDAWRQRQLDVYGELMGAAFKLRNQLGEMNAVTREFLLAVADAAATRWTEKDHGIWEFRTEPKHYVHSKLMCWVALQRATELESLLEPERRQLQRWREAREKIRAAILEQGWNERLGSFTQSFGDDVLDASNLVIPIVGFLPADDPRVRSTVAAIRERLTDDDGLVLRYSPVNDGLQGEEGAFLLCSFWLAEALARMGDIAAARELFEKAIAHGNDLGLLAEEVERGGRRMIGNYPQAFSHVGLVNAAWAISECQKEG